MEQHMIKEESVLFPAILDMEKQAGSNEFLKQGFSVDAPIQMMEAEHEMAGKIMDEIRQLSNHYTIPDAACTTFAVSLKELKLFEEDLHRHVHLENYVLFPKAIAFQEKERRKYLFKRIVAEFNLFCNQHFLVRNVYCKTIF